MIEGGMRARKIAEILDRSESTVPRFLKRYQETGNIENKHRSGMPKLITERGGSWIYNLPVQSVPITTKSVSRTPFMAR
jgi:transposase